MIEENEGEYANLRDELEKLKGCITSYVGFLFVILGGAFWVAVVSVTKDKLSWLTAYAAMFFSFLLASMLSVLLYKFASHNRYVGYLLCLVEERFPSKIHKQREYDPNSKVKNWKLWEPSMDCWRFIDLDDREYMWHKNHIETKVDFNRLESRYTEIREKLKRCNDIDTEYYKKIIAKLYKSFTYFGTAFKAFTMSQKTLSWGFPVTVVRIYIIFILFFDSITLVAMLSNDWYLGLYKMSHHLILFFVFLLHCCVLYNLIKRYHEVVRGTRTIHFIL